MQTRARERSNVCKLEETKEGANVAKEEKQIKKCCDEVNRTLRASGKELFKFFVVVATTNERESKLL